MSTPQKLDYVLQLAEAITPDLKSQALRRVAQDSPQGLAVQFFLSEKHGNAMANDGLSS